MLDYLQLYPQTIELVKRYKEDQRCRLYEAMAFYAFTGAEPTWPEDAAEWLIWEALKQTVDRADKKVNQNKRNANRKEEEDSEPERNEAKPSETERTEANPSEPERTEANRNESDNHKPKTITHETINQEIKKDGLTPPKPPAKKAEDDFAMFWAVYPKKQDKQNALKAWKKLNPDTQTLRKIILAIQAQRASPQWQKDGGQYIPMPSTWLNGHRWEDQPIQAPGGKQVSAQNYEQRTYTEEDLAGTQPDLLAEARALRTERAAM